VAVKQGLFTDLFMERPRVTVRDIKKYLISHGCMGEGGAPSGLDITFKSGLRSRCIFKQMLGKGLLTEEDVEKIILHAAYTEDKGRMRRWLGKEFPQLPEEDVDYILRQKLKGFRQVVPAAVDGDLGRGERFGRRGDDADRGDVGAGPQFDAAFIGSVYLPGSDPGAQQRILCGSSQKAFGPVV
jgi:CRISPR-associated endonuclease Csn1